MFSAPNYPAAIAAITVKDNSSGGERPYVFLGGPGIGLAVNYWDGSTWRWEDWGFNHHQFLIGATSVNDGPNGSDRPCVVAIDSHLWLNRGAAWQWEDQGVPLIPEVLYSTVIPPGGQPAPGSAALFEDLNPVVFDRTWSVPTIITVKDTPNSSERPYAFLLSYGGALSGRLWANYWDGSAWQWSEQGTPADQVLNVLSAPCAITVKDSPVAGERPYVFVVGESDGHLWVNYWDGSA